MPLIIITGYPTSGKSHRASQLHSFFTSHILSLPPTNPSSTLRVHLISDHILSIPRQTYNLSTKTLHERTNNSSEKDSRATLFSSVKRLLSPKDIVILDSGNYMKGWRYQLFCEAKAQRTPSCVVHIGTPIDKCKEINEGRLARADGGNEGEKVDDAAQESAYSAENWENLVFRYEEPNAFARWDSPLFTVLWDDEMPACQEIWDSLIGSPDSKPVTRPNQATVLKAPAREDYLYELDKTTQGILNSLLEWAKDHPGEGGGRIDVGEGEEELVVELPSNVVGLPALQRLRRQFIGLNRKDAVPVKRIRESFVAYLNDSFESS